VSLVNAGRGSAIATPSFVEAQYSPEFLLQGAHFNEPSELCFPAAGAAFTHLEEWSEDKQLRVTESRQGPELCGMVPDHKGAQNLSVQVPSIESMMFLDDALAITGDRLLEAGFKRTP
jgi:hypothetical protein